MEEYVDWFWGLDASELEKLPPVVSALLDAVPLVVGVVAVLGVLILVVVRGKSRESEEAVLTGLDKEVEAVKRLQRERGI